MTLENTLREALRPVDPGDEFTDAVMRRLQQPPQLHQSQQPQVLRRARRRWQVPAALAASLLLAITGLLFV